MKNREIKELGKELTFDEAARAVFVAVRRGAKFIILAVKKVITSFTAGVMNRMLILSDGSHYFDSDFKGKCFEV